MSSPPEEPQKPIVTEDVVEEVGAPGCGILARFPVLSVLLFAAIGIGAGVGLSFWEPENMENKKILLQWLGLVGDLFIRALKCVVLPLVFVNVIISVVDMMTVGKASSIGWKTIGLYLLTTVCACILGILSTLALKGLYSESEDAKAASPPYIQLGCSRGDGYYVTEGDDGSLTCAMVEDEADASMFILSDMTNTFMRKSKGGPASDISLSDTVYDGVFRKLVTSNIVSSFASANFAAVVFFAICFGVALARVLERQKRESGTDLAVILTFLKELDQVFLTLINWVIAITPFAVFSLIVKAVGGQNDLRDAFANVGYLVIATMLAMVLQVILVYFGLFAIVTKSNPMPYLSKIVPAQTMAFACASSAATIPMTLQCVRSTRKVPESIARFVVPLGATVNMDGGAIYFPCACIWLAVLNGADVNVASYILLVIISTLGSVGTAPVPSASLVLIITAYNTVFNTTGTPEGFSFILAIDWFMDRLRTTVNVTGDTVVAGMVSHLCPLEDGDDERMIDPDTSDEHDAPVVAKVNMVALKSMDESEGEMTL